MSEYTFDLGSATTAPQSIYITVPREKWDGYFEAIEKLAVENGFKHQIRRVKKDVDLFFINLWREDVAVNCVNYSRVEEFDLAFFIDTTKGGTVAAVEELISIFEKELSAIPGVSVTTRQEESSASPAEE